MKNFIFSVNQPRQFFFLCTVKCLNAKMLLKRTRGKIVTCLILTREEREHMSVVFLKEKILINIFYIFSYAPTLY